MIARCAQLLAWLRRAVDPFPGALELAAGLRKDLQRLRAHVVEFRIALAEARVAATLRRRRRTPARRNGRAVIRGRQAPQH
jgi:hypothetical protein